MEDGILQVARLFGKQTLSEKQARIAEALQQHPLMTDEQLVAFYKALLILQHKRGYKRKTRELLRTVVTKEMVERGLL